jgi:hypothetical protein
MKKYGLRIGSTGVEFGSREDREKALLKFTKGSCVDINTSYGLRYKDSTGSFSTYERETEEQTTNCAVCTGMFSSETCTKRTVPEMDWNGKFKGVDKTEERVLCDACFAKRNKDFEVWKAKQVLGASDDD